MVGVMVPMHVPIPKLTAATMGPRSVVGKHNATQAIMHATEPRILPKRRPKRSQIAPSEILAITTVAMMTKPEATTSQPGKNLCCWAMDYSLWSAI